MTKPTKIEVNCTTGVETITELTNDEIAQLELDRVAFEERQAKEEAAKIKLAEAKASALAKLAALGLTEDEAKAIAG
jgi:hypothetical protein